MYLLKIKVPRAYSLLILLLHLVQLLSVPSHGDRGISYEQTISVSLVNLILSLLFMVLTAIQENVLGDWATYLLMLNQAVNNKHREIKDYSVKVTSMI